MPFQFGGDEGFFGGAFRRVGTALGDTGLMTARLVETSRRAPDPATIAEARSLGFFGPNPKSARTRSRVNARSRLSSAAGKVTPLAEMPEVNFLQRLGLSLGGGALGAVENVVPEFVEDKLRRLAGLPTQRDVLKAQSVQARAFSYVPPGSAGGIREALDGRKLEQTTGFPFLDSAITGLRSQLTAAAEDIGGAARAGLGTIPVDVGVGQATSFLKQWGIPLAIAALAIAAIFVLKKK